MLTPALLLAAGCGNKGSAPAKLADGSPAAPPRVALETVSQPTVATTYRVVRSGAIRVGSPTAACLRGPARGVGPQGPVVERTGVDGETVTIRNSAGVIACDSVPSGGARWCGSSFGRLHRGHLRDPRLDIGGCMRSGGTAVAFAWVEPDRGTRYVAVEGDGYAEVYEPAAGLPVRVSTRDVSTDASGATFHVTEHDASGKLIRRFELETVPAG